MARRLDVANEGFAQAFDALLAARGDRLDAAEAQVRPILADVRARGLDAVLDWTERFDGVRLDAGCLAVGADEIAAARAASPGDLIAALETAAERIRAFHVRARPQDGAMEGGDGVTLGWRWTPIDAAGIYAPGGLAAYPSSILMNVLPARAAGVRRIALATPPGRIGENPAILAAAAIAGVDEIWRIGGAQAIGALAYGAGPIAPCDVIAGPGNAFVAAAKKAVFGDVGVDSVAGPSEVFILVQKGAAVAPAWIAADLLAQAEHDEDAQAVLLTDDAAFADAVAAEVGAALAAGAAGPCAAVSWARHGAIVQLRAIEEGPALLDRAAAEHVQVIGPDATALAGRIRHAGAIFIGAHAPEALGDYIAGPSHVLPTGRTARFSSGVSTATFMKRISLIGADARGLDGVGRAALRLAQAEGLPAHAQSLRLRLAP